MSLGSYAIGAEALGALIPRPSRAPTLWVSGIGALAIGACPVAGGINYRAVAPTPPPPPTGIFLQTRFIVNLGRMMNR